MALTEGCKTPHEANKAYEKLVGFIRNGGPHKTNEEIQSFLDIEQRARTLTVQGHLRHTLTELIAGIRQGKALNELDAEMREANYILGFAYAMDSCGDPIAEYTSNTIEDVCEAVEAQTTDAEDV